MSICPKNKTSKARRDKRRANWKMSAPNLVKCSKFGSQGQQRTAALSLKLSEIELVKEVIKDTPILLLDDV